MKIVAEVEYDRGAQIGAGQGMNSKVYLAQDPQFAGQIVAKEIPKADFGNRAQDFFKEAQATFAAAHPNVVRLHYAGQTTDHVCMTMPYFSRGSLQDRLTSGSLSLRKALRVTDGVLSGLGHVHAQGYVHFDVKPTNVLFDASDRPLVADFGQARRMASVGFAQAPRMYVPAFPPEVLLNGVGGVPADIYQVGITLYRALNGEGFYQANKAKVTDFRTEIALGKFPPRQRFLPHVPTNLRTIVRRALEVDPAARFQSAREMADALAKVAPPVDWKANGSGPEYEWTATREGKRDLVVALAADGGRWRVESFTSDGQKRRGAKKATCWASGLARARAFTHLRAVFRQLSVPG